MTLPTTKLTIFFPIAKCIENIRHVYIFNEWQFMLKKT